MLLALSSQLHQVRSRISIAEQQSKDGHPGAACADLLVCFLAPPKGKRPQQSISRRTVKGDFLFSNDIDVVDRSGLPYKASLDEREFALSSTHVWNSHHPAYRGSIVAQSDFLRSNDPAL